MRRLAFTNIFKALVNSCFTMEKVKILEKVEIKSYEIDE